jgi:steroid 5-alpha reductase family enzyme
VTAAATGRDPAADRRRLLAAVAAAYATALGAALATALALAGRHPLLVAGAADVAATLAVFAFSVRHDNASLYDPYWSVAPVPIALYLAAAAPPGAAAPLRRALALALVLAWAARLTFNCLARWRSLADEDFRYVEIRRRTGRLYWPASLISIHLLPTGWVFLGLLPLYPALALPGRPAGWLDLAAALVAGGAVAVEAVADRQLRAFLAARRDPAAVLDAGLWARCRHPNYLGEILFWWGLWLLGLAAAPGWWWTVAGPLAITLLFALVSVPWMDRRMLSRHPAYAARLRATPALLPWPRRR